MVTTPMNGSWGLSTLALSLFTTTNIHCIVVTVHQIENLSSVKFSSIALWHKWELFDCIFLATIVNLPFLTWSLQTGSSLVWVVAYCTRNSMCQCECTRCLILVSQIFTCHCDQLHLQSIHSQHFPKMQAHDICWFIHALIPVYEFLA